MMSRFTDPRNEASQQMFSEQVEGEDAHRQQPTEQGSKEPFARGGEKGPGIGAAVARYPSAGPRPARITGFKSVRPVPGRR